jgi:hypothetical protein
MINISPYALKENYASPERQARDKIDQWLADAGWRIVPYPRWQASIDVCR